MGGVQHGGPDAANANTLPQACSEQGEGEEVRASVSRGRPEARLFQNGRRTARQQRCVRSISNEAVENGKAKVPVQGAGRAL